jgi:ATP-dependent helicase HrpA
VGVRRWDFGELPEVVRVLSAGVVLRMYPAIEDAGVAVQLRLYPTAALAQAHTRYGVTRLAALAMPQQHDLVRRSCAADHELALLTATAGFGKSLFEEIADRAVADAVAVVDGRMPRSSVEFEARIDAARARVVDRGAEVARVAKTTLLASKDARAALARLGAPAFAATREAVKRQLDARLAPGWVRHTPEPWFFQLPKYVRAAARRLERLRDGLERDRLLQVQLAPYEAALLEIDAAADPERASVERERLRWMLEEFRVSLFAQELRTLLPVSPKRLDEQVRLARREAGRA